MISALARISLGSAIVAPSAVLGVLALSSRFAGNHRHESRESGFAGRVLVLVPAHDEEAGIGPVIDRIRASDRSERIDRLLVIADNCSDRTADRARAAGAHVIERVDPGFRGKGEALAWTLTQPGVLDGFDHVMIFDADDHPELEAVATALIHAEESGAHVIQLPHISGKPEDGVASAAVDMWTTTLMNRVRARGFAGFGLSSRLQGGGMLVDAAMLRRHGWPATGVSEDFFASLAFADLSVKSSYCDARIVWSDSARGDEARRIQRTRWESGRIRAWSHLPALLSSSFRKRSATHAALATYIAVPPLTVHMAAWVVAGLVSVFDNRLRPWTVASAVGTGLYLVEGLRLLPDRRTRQVAMMAAPRFAIWKLGVFRDALVGFRSHAWSRTPREDS